MQVWQALMQIPEGRTATYGQVAEAIGSPKAVRAVGTAIGRNPIAYIIPCHRVLRATGALGGYHWGVERKQVLLGYEASAQSAIPH
jgi:AraC family transcriptional regulator of adaptative response/methylated-DNA-[protein]-cysteine methyltransferase